MYVNWLRLLNGLLRFKVLGFRVSGLGSRSKGHIYCASGSGSEFPLRI